ncbi:hypothetical protein BVRB_7g167690 [Beta vulgaris subsp. vulgaris]|nr:hypothetical protein BVRB_7g167690 [Beta vulgaris subsp. vulgaris]
MSTSICKRITSCYAQVQEQSAFQRKKREKTSTSAAMRARLMQHYNRLDSIVPVENPTELTLRPTFHADNSKALKILSL